MRDVLSIDACSKDPRKTRIWYEYGAITPKIVLSLTSYSWFNQPLFLLERFVKNANCSIFIYNGCNVNIVMFGNKEPSRWNRGFLLQILLLAQHVSGITMPIIRSSRVLYSGCCLWHFVLWFSSYWSGVELRVCRMLQHPANRTHNPQLHTRPTT